VKRRGFLLGGLGAGAALVVGVGLLPPRGRLGERTLPQVADGVALNGWIEIARDGAVVLAMNRSEMGQGVHTALAMLVAEELDVPLARVRLEQAGPQAIYGNVAAFVANLPLRPDDTGRSARAVRFLVAKLARELGINITGGSTSVVDAWDVLRLAAATARAQLLGAAALQWKLPRDELSIAAGVISHPSGPKAGFGELAAMAAGTPVGAVEVKPREQWRLIGTSAPRGDVAAKSDGSARFGIDARPPGLLHASLRMCPQLGGSPGPVDVDALLRRPGVVRVVRLPALSGSTAGIAVVARTWWQAEQAAAAMQVEWRAAPSGRTPHGARIETELERAARAGRGHVFHERGDVASAESVAARRIEAVYRAPYLAHATMEPINCTARVEGGKVEVWASTQVPGLARAVAARVARVQADAVTLHVGYLGGGFGRRLEVDVIAQAVRIALETGGRPVQLVWPREEDLRHDFYRPAGVALLRGALDAQGHVTSLAVASAGDAIVPRWTERNLPGLAGPFDLPDKSVSEGLYDLPYAIANQRISHRATTSGVPVGYWRSVGHSHNAFFGESFIDELARAAGADPLEFRLRLLEASPRHAAVLRAAAQQAGWGTPPAQGRARGLALHESFGSVVAQVLEVSIETTPQGRRPRVHRVVCAIDCGSVVNPGIVAQQMESGIVFGLSAALHGRIDIEQGVVRQGNFPDYRLVGMSDCPAIETHIVPSEGAPGGVGETAVPLLAPALGNALAALTGQRLRSLPFVL
jgi:isoquinoline 1-oxidoreductase beta subunit